MPPLSDPHHTPRTHGFQRQRPDGFGGGWLPDAVTDTTAKRRARARRLKGNGHGVAARLLACPGQLYHVVYHLQEPGNLYLDGRDLALAALDRLPPGLPLYWKLCASVRQHLHLHLLVAILDPALLEVLAGLGFYCIPIRDDAHLESLLEYFSRPNDEASARPNRKGFLRYGNDQWEARFAAAERYLEAREVHGRRPLPRLSGTRNLPFLKPERLSHLHLAVLRKGWARTAPLKPTRWKAKRARATLPVQGVSLVGPYITSHKDKPWLTCRPRGPPEQPGYVVGPPRPLPRNCTRVCPLPNHATPMRSHRRTPLAHPNTLRLSSACPTFPSRPDTPGPWREGIAHSPLRCRCLESGQDIDIRQQDSRRSPPQGTMQITHE